MARDSWVKLHINAWRKLQRMIEWWEALTVAGNGSLQGSTITIHRQRTGGGGVSNASFPARITGNASLATNKWKYAWTEVERSNDTWTDVVDGRSGTTTTDYAVNRAEQGHSSTYAWGVDLTGSDFPGGMAPRPIGGAGSDNTHKYDRVVTIYVVNEDGTTKYEFDAMGSIDGSCT